MKASASLYNALFVVVFLFFAERASRAQQAPGFVLPTFDPSERGSDWFASESLDLRGSLRPAAGLVVDWAHDPLVVANPDGSTRTPLVADQVLLHAGGSLVLADRIRLSLDLPLGLAQGRSFTLGSAAFSAPAAFAPGDLRVGADVRLYGVYDGPLTLGAGAQLYLPTGSRASYSSDGTVRVQPRLLAAGRVGWFGYAAEIEFQYRPLRGAFDNSELGSTLGFGAAAGAKALRDALTVGPEIFGSTVVTSAEGPFHTQNTPLNAILGAHYQIASVRVGLGGGAGLTRGLGSPAARFVASVEWSPPWTREPEADQDGDGIFDREDACPAVAGVRTSDRRTNGCPTDRDHDEIADKEDACPDTPGVRAQDPKTNGCPLDADGDGIADAQDACAKVPGVRTEDPFTNGCPPDRDHDTIPDAEDACPDLPGVRTADAKTNGCPPAPDPDRDKDGVANEVDACPDVPGKPNRDPKKNGCPLAYVQGASIRITDQVKFRTDSTQIDRAAEPVLAAVAAVLKSHLEIQHLLVEGHTDNVGTGAHNQSLSEGRAAAVTDWLVAHGIARSRLASIGYGMSKPLGQRRRRRPTTKSARRVPYREHGRDPVAVTYHRFHGVPPPHAV